MKRHEEGITLIALIITIIILIILTAITISNVMGSNLFGLAKGAAENYVDAGKEEENAINELVSVAGEIGRIKPISKEEAFVGYYADIEDDGTVDGIIYADLAVGNTKSGAWGSGGYTISLAKDKSTLAEYYVKEESYEGPFGTAKVIAPINRDKDIENDRFYVMALKDIDGKQNGTKYDWYNAAAAPGVGIFAGVKYTIGSGFGGGRRNTTNMMAKWNDPELPCGEHDKCKEHKDIWGQIGDLVDKGWFVPSTKEWLTFGGELGITTTSGTDGYYLDKGLSDEYWTSSDSGYFIASLSLIKGGQIYGNKENTAYSVRLSTTF